MERNPDFLVAVARHVGPDILARIAHLDAAGDVFLLRLVGEGVRIVIIVYQLDDVAMSCALWLPNFAQRDKTYMVP